MLITAIDSAKIDTAGCWQRFGATPVVNPVTVIVVVIILLLMWRLGAIK